MTTLSDSKLIAAAHALSEAVEECDENDVTVMELALDRDDWAWLADALHDAGDGLDATAKLAQFAEHLHAALNPSGGDAIGGEAS